MNNLTRLSSQTWSICTLLLVSGLFLAAPVYAQNSMDPVVRDASLDEFPASGSLTETDVRSMRRLIEDHKQSMRNEEANLLRLKRGIEASGWTALSFLNRMQELQESLDEETFWKLINSTEEELTQMNSPEVEEIKKARVIMLELKPKVQALFKPLNEYIHNTLDLSIAMMLYTLRQRLSALSPDQQTPELKKSFERLIKKKNEYLALKGEFGGGKDSYRTGAYQGFFRTAKDMVLQMDYPRTYKIRRMARSGWQSLKVASWFIRNPMLAPRLADTVIRLLLNQKPTGTNNPLMASVARLSRSVRLGMGMTVDIVGEENLLGLQNDGVKFQENDIFIYTPSHRDLIKDQLALSYVKNDNIMPFASVNSFPKWLNLKLNANPGFVPVAGSKGEFTPPIQKAVNNAANTELRHFGNYAEGKLPDGLGSTAGPREKFFAEGGLVDAFESFERGDGKKNFRVNIVPIVLVDNAKLFGGRSLTRKDKKITMLVGTPILAKTRYLINRLAGKDSGSLILRYGLIENLVTNHELLWGQVRGSKLTEALNEFVFGNPSCEGMMGSASRAL